MNKKYIFDVDGTLTPSRLRINEDFRLWFSDFCIDNEVYIVTGSDRGKTIEQLTEYLYNLCQTVYQCSGNDVWKDVENIRAEVLSIPQKMIDMLDNFLEESSFPIRTGQHLDIRPGLANFSIIGRGCTIGQRADYIKHDRLTGERSSISKQLNEIFPNYLVSVAGDTGVDITMKGYGKEQILKDFNDDDVLYFFGDKCQVGGNDHDIAVAVDQRGNGSTSFNVSDWKETWTILKQL